MNLLNRSRLYALMLAIGGSVLPAGIAHAQFNLQAGTDKGILELASRTTGAGGANAFFRNDGLMLQAGGNYPAISTNVNNNVVNTGLVQLPAAVASGANGNFGGGSASLFSVSGNRAGIFTNNFSFTDTNILDGVASESAMYGQGSWTYNGPAGQFLGGAYLSMTASVDPNVNGSYVEAGVDALFSINGVPVAQRFISFGFDGVANPGAGYAGGPLASFINADRYVYVTNGPSVTFSAASYVALNLNPGDTLSIQGTLTAFGDPASMTYNADPTFNAGNDDTGVSAAPEPGSIVLALSASAPIVGLALRRKRQG